MNHSLTVVLVLIFHTSQVYSQSTPVSAGCVPSETDMCLDGFKAISTFIAEYSEKFKKKYADEPINVPEESGYGTLEERKEILKAVEAERKNQAPDWQGIKSLYKNLFQLNNKCYLKAAGVDTTALNLSRMASLWLEFNKTNFDGASDVLAKYKKKIASAKEILEAAKMGKYSNSAEIIAKYTADIPLGESEILKAEKMVKRLETQYTANLELAAGAD
jgi:hypothetical protein